MCYYNSYHTNQSQLFVDGQKVHDVQSFDKPVESCFNYSSWPVVIKGSDGYEFSIMDHWAIIPEFAKNLREANEFCAKYSTANAVTETMYEKKTFVVRKDNEVKVNRCLVLSTGFYEWRHEQKIGKRGEYLKATEAIPYYITVKSDEPFYMAGIWKPWIDNQTNEVIATFAICTQPANEIMQYIHNKKKRMPMILPGKLAAKWLDETLSSDQVTDFANYQLSSDFMQAHTVSKDFRSSPNPSEYVPNSEVIDRIGYETKG